MKTGLSYFLGIFTTTLILSTADLRAANASLDWTGDLGFSASAVTIDQGESVTIHNADEGSSLVVFADLPEANPDYFYFDIVAGTSNFHTYNTPGTFTFKSEYNQTVTVTVNSTGGGEVTPIHLSNPRVSSGLFQLDVAGLTVGKTYHLQVSTNYVDWTNVQTDVAVSTSTTLSDPVSGGIGIYRIVQLP